MGGLVIDRRQLLVGAVRTWRKKQNSQYLRVCVQCCGASPRGGEEELTLGPSRRPIFDRPPIVEIGISILFQRPQFLTTAYLGRFWERIAAQMPRTEDHAPTGLPHEWTSSIEGLPLPRLWLLNQPGTEILQLQVNRMDFNWRRLQADSPYPNFERHAQYLLSYWDMFAAFMSEQDSAPVVIRGAEILKMSQVPEGEGWTDWTDLQKLLPMMNFRTLAGEWGYSSFISAAEMNHAEGKIRVDVKVGSLISDPSRKKTLTLEIRSEASDLRASSRDRGNLAERLTAANDLANLAFTSITSPEAQRDVWKRKA